MMICACELLLLYFFLLFIPSLALSFSLVFFHPLLLFRSSIRQQVITHNCVCVCMKMCVHSLKYTIYYRDTHERPVNRRRTMNEVGGRDGGEEEESNEIGVQ